MMCCTPSGYIIFSLRNLKFYESRRPGAGGRQKTQQKFSCLILGGDQSRWSPSPGFDLLNCAFLSQRSLFCRSVLIPKRLRSAYLNSSNVLFKLADLLSMNIVAPCCWCEIIGYILKTLLKQKLLFFLNFPKVSLICLLDLKFQF